ncbi:MAG: OsmC family protein [Bacteroidetes bacterium]|nr:OsmC family protein [Bacteroidota bacterium]
MTATVTYESNLRTTCLHLQSGSNFETDAPTDNKGKGERFSPTDLIATGLGACMITTMGIKAESMNIALDGAKVEVTKVMVSDPRRIGKIITHLTIPSGLNLDDKTKEILERAAHHCPVVKTLHPEVELEISFNWQ